MYCTYHVITHYVMPLKIMLFIAKLLLFKYTPEVSSGYDWKKR